MNQLYIDDEAYDDLDRLVSSGTAEEALAADMLEAFLDDISASADTTFTLSKRNWQNQSPHFNVKAIECFLQKGYNISRLRPLPRRLKVFRCIFAFDNENEDFYVLAIVRKVISTEGTIVPTYDTYDYEPNHRITQRIERLYEKHSFPKLQQY